jgi:hypothetical protein
VAANRLDQFLRVPSELRQYRLYIEELIREYGSVMRFVLGEYGSVMRFVLDERLGWKDLRAGEGRFEDPGT